MLGIIYLLLCFGTGWVICELAFPKLHSISRSSYDNKSINLSPYFLLLPAWFITGVLSMTWLVYIIASVSSKMEAPLVMANIIMMPLALILLAFTLYNRLLKNKEYDKSLISEDNKTKVKELIILCSVTLLGIVLFWSTFYVNNGQLHIGVSVFSDFHPI